MYFGTFRSIITLPINSQFPKNAIHTSSSFSSSFLGVSEDPEPNPPRVVGAEAHALALPVENPPNNGFLVSPSPSFGVVGTGLVNDPKILEVLSETVLAALTAVSFTASAVVAGSTCDGVAVAEGVDGDSVESFAARSLVSSMTGASLLTPDIVMMISWTEGESDGRRV